MKSLSRYKHHKVVEVMLNDVPQKTRNCLCCLDLVPAATPVPAGFEGLGWLHELSTLNRTNNDILFI